MATNSGGWLYEPTGTPVDKATADNAQARVLEIKADASAAKSDAASALSTANSYAGQIAQANTTAGSALATAQGAVDTADNAADRVDALEVMGGVQPGSVNDAEMKLHAEQDGGLFNTALKAQIDEAVPARPLPSIATPSELIARFLDFKGGFMRGAMAGDSTVNDGNDPGRKALIRLGQLTPTGVGMKERMWSTASNSYATDVTVKEGSTTASVGGTVLTDNFNRTAAEMVGSTTSGGQVWAGSAGSWSANGSAATANGPHSIGFDTKSKAHTNTAVLNVVTTGQTAQSQTRVLVGATRPDVNAGGNYVWAQIAITNTGIPMVSVWKRINGVQTEIATAVQVNELETGSATPQQATVKVDIAIQAVTATITVGGVDQVITATVTEADTGALGTFAVLVSPANDTGAFSVDSVTFVTPYTPGTYTGLEVWNAAVGGTMLSYQKARMATMYPSDVHFDWLFVTSGHNGGTQSPEAFIAEVDGFIQAFRAEHPETLIVISSQNPQFAPATTITAHARRQAALRDYAMAQGLEYLPVFEEFSNQPDGGASLVMSVDGIHPTVSSITDITTWCGNLLWTAVWLNIINSRRIVGATTPITDLP